jgi:hypothetical protein
MYVTNKKIELPTELNIAGNQIQIFNSIKILGVTIDNKLSFSKYCSQIRQAVNKKLYSIKRLLLYNLWIFPQRNNTKARQLLQYLPKQIAWIKNDNS